MTEPKWFSKRIVLAIHDEALAMFGGGAGIRDEGLLESALSRPQNLHGYDETATLFDLAASLCFELAKNHPFVDGNKRTALLSARAFLCLNGYAFEPTEYDEVENMVAVASSQMTEETLARWFEAYSTPIV